MLLRKSILLLFFFNISVQAQEKFTILTIPDELKENANAVIRRHQTDITINSRRPMTIKEERIVTVLNEYGQEDVVAMEYFNEASKVKSIEAVIYNAFGNEVKKIKRKDFRERAVTDGFSVITDNRVLYMDYTPTQYPYTVHYTSEVETENTAFFDPWVPLHGNYASTEYAGISIAYKPELGFKYKTYNFPDGILKKEESTGSLKLSVEKLAATRREEYAPGFLQIAPYAVFGLEKFNLEGVEGDAASWEALGSWMYNSLLTGTDELPAETVQKIKQLTANASSNMEKARIVYEYMQGKTRYISIQLGIGGWKPMQAKDVDRLGYGDCKALTNYTRSLLKAVGVESYYSVVYGDSDKRDLREDFVSMQGNHAILAIPDNNKLVWLECTSQDLPFGFQGAFTADRKVLIVTPEGGRIVRTRVYNDEGNTQVSLGSYTLTENGGITGAVTFTSAGLQYDDKYGLQSASPDDIKRIYKKRFGYINNIMLENTALNHSKDKQQITEEIKLSAESYASKSGNRIIFAINAFNQSTSVPQRYRDRKMPFEVTEGYHDTDEVTINLPDGFIIEAKPENTVITEKFGEYRAEYVMVNEKQILYRRSLLVKSGLYDSADYEDYRQFCDKVARQDNAKAVLVKN